MGLFKRTKTEEPTKVAESKPTAASIKAGAVASDVIVRPLVTEKSAHLAAVGQYVFEIDPSANKIQVKNAIRAMYAVTPTSVNIQNLDGKDVRYGRTRGTRRDWKKAIVTLPKGKKIEVYEGV